MPTSTWKSISQIMDVVMALNPHPKTILDIGIGNGKYGFLLKEYLSYWGARYSTKLHEVNIDGIEVFPEYIKEMHKHIYDHIIIGNAYELLPTFPDKKYDLILLIDVLEHFSISDGKFILEECRRVGDFTLVSTPIEMENQGVAYGNEYERHLSCWDKGELTREGATIVFNSSDQNWIALITENRDGYLNEISFNQSKFRTLLKVILPYRIRKNTSNFLKRF